MPQQPKEIPKLNYQTPPVNSFRTWIAAALAVAILLGIITTLALTGNFFNRTRDESPLLKCASNMKQIGMAILLYSNDNHNQYPPALATLLTAEDIPSEIFICPDTPATGPTTQSTASQLPTGHHLSYLYLGAGLTTTCDPNTLVLLEPLSNHSNTGSNALFADGHVEFLPTPTAQQLLARYANGEHPLIWK